MSPQSVPYLDLVGFVLDRHYVDPPLSRVTIPTLPLPPQLTLWTSIITPYALPSYALGLIISYAFPILTPPLALPTPSRSWWQPIYLPHLEFKLDVLQSFFQLLDSLPRRQVGLHNVAPAPETAELTATRRSSPGRPHHPIIIDSFNAGRL
ncbi:hypothetical protein N7471_005503 [Penicillium samsonianum]|uniref:uncharacterized protein n=1 Tax=Penicillium samsonianum TaxID=1882272 RepID=UPI002546A5B9|nr:uncharacterized protein N7471_005503 [Penicillium samsonianum]KAJ6139017.1 hypothetical protein N7471_005503 [Penicillium samsonianum]